MRVHILAANAESDQLAAVTKFLVVSNTKLRGILSPLAVAAGDEICDHPAHILLLRGVVVGTGMVARDRHGPGFVAGMQLGQELRRILDIARRLQHLPRRGEGFAVKMVVDLHATKVDQNSPPAARLFENGERVVRTGGENGLPFDVQRPGLQGTLLARFGETNRIENPLRDTIFGSGPMDLLLAKSRLVRLRGAGLRDRPDRNGQCRKQEREDRQPSPCHRSANLH